MSIQISPSLLAADLCCLGEEISRAAEGGCDTLHVDIMDWHFVPNLSFGPNIVSMARSLTDVPLDVHLMSDRPLEMAEEFANAGANYLTIHVEAVRNVEAAIGALRDLGVHPGISFRPDTPVDAVTRYLGMVDMVLVMSVMPGHGGQEFMGSSYWRVRRIAEAAADMNKSLIISVDGGVGFENAPKLVDAGANYLVAGTSIFAGHDAAANIRRMRDAVQIAAGEAK